MEILGGIFLLLIALVLNKVGAFLGGGVCGVPSILFALFGAGTIFVGFWEMGNEAELERVRNEKKALPPENVTASELIANKIRAENRYKDRKLNVTGIITNITKHITDIGATVTLNGKPSENEKGVSCNFMWNRYVENLSIGQTVTISGIYRYDNYMEECSIYDLNPSSQSYSPAPKPEPAKSSNPVFDSMLSRASAGDAKAQYELSQAYFDGEIVARNDDEGLKWLMKSAENNYVEAFVELGGMYLNGFLVKQDLEKGQYYIKKAAALGHEQAKFILSITERLTIPKPSMPDEEYASIRKEATNGDPEAQYKLGKFYFEELHDNREAVRWFFKSAQQGYSEAAINMEIIFKADPGLWSWFINNPDARN